MISIAVMGPVCAGKTTFVRSLSDGTPISTDEPATTSIGKAQTTVGVDVGRTRIEGHDVKLIGSPGQEQFEKARSVHPILPAPGRDRNYPHRSSRCAGDPR